MQGPPLPLLGPPMTRGQSQSYQTSRFMSHQARLTNLLRVKDPSFKNKILVVSRMTFISYIVYNTNTEPSRATLGRTMKKTSKAGGGVICDSHHRAMSPVTL